MESGGGDDDGDSDGDGDGDGGGDVEKVRTGMALLERRGNRTARRTNNIIFYAYDNKLRKNNVINMNFNETSPQVMMMMMMMMIRGEIRTHLREKMTFD